MSLSFVALDFETANNNRDSACSIGIVKVENCEIVAKDVKLINPQTYFLDDFTNNIHGISVGDVENAPLFNDVWHELSPLVKGVDFIAAHNASFDKSVLYHCCDKFKIKRPEQKFVCTVQLARKNWNIKPTQLNNVCDYLDIELNHHNALSDALACAQIVIKAKKLKGWRFQENG